MLTCALDALGLCDGFYDGFQFPEGQLLNGGTTFLPTIGSWLGMSGASDKLQYTAASANVIPSTYSLTDVVTTEGGVDTAWAPWHPWLPAVNTGDTYDLAVGASIVHPFRVNLTNNSVQGSPRGWMVVSVDDASGEWQAELVPIGALP